jgi:F-box protein 18 (helicase)
LDYDYDVIMLDEAQDASPVMWSVVKNQDACGKILVGDPNQEIYGFAGAKNAMDAAAAATPAEHLTRRTLSVSFRFGPEIASVACSLLALKGSADAVVGARRADVDEEAGGGR